MKHTQASVIRLSLFVLVTAALLTGCGGTQPASTFSITITSPSTNALLFWNQYLGIPVHIAVSTSQSADDWMLYVNGSMAADFSDSNRNAGDEFGIPWTIPGPGLYRVSVVGRNTHNNSSGHSDVVVICLLSISEDAASVDHAFPYGYTGPCPPASPNATSNDAVLLHTTASPASLAENYQCSTAPPAPILSFTANLNDPGQRTLFVTVEYRGTRSANLGSINPQALVLNKIGPNTYYGSTDSDPRRWANLANLMALTRNSSGSLVGIEWTAKAWGGHGELLASDGPHEIPVNPCQVLPEPTETPVTPIIIRPNPNNPGGTNPHGCARFTTQTSCNLAGCSWNYGSCTVNP
jgi:hypothetical protein